MFGGETMVNKKTGEPKSTLGRQRRVKERLKNKISNTSGGRYAMCEACGVTFEQVWREEHKTYTSFKTCGHCRMANAHGKSSATILYSPHPGQQLIHDSPARFKLAACGGRWGKDRCMIMEYLEKYSQMLSEDRGPELVPSVHGWIIAPVFPLARQIWRELKAYFPREWVRNIWEADKMIETVNDGIIELKSADDPDFLVGVGLDIVLITEAARISRLDEMWANIETRLLSPGRGPGGKGGLALINGTPKGRNYFHKMYRWGQKGDDLYDSDWESWNFPTFDNPYLAKKDLQQLEKMRKRYPERIFNQEILAMFLAEGNSVFPTADECAIYRGDGRPIPGEIYVIGYDPARSIDHTGVAVRNGSGQCVLVEQWTGVPWTLQMDKIAQLSQRYHYATVVIDKTGLGETLPEALTQRGVDVEAVHFTNPEKEKMVNHLAMLIEQMSICYPDLPNLVEQLKDYEYTTTKTGIIRYSASTSHKHDDLVTALMLCYKNYQIPDLALPWVGLLGGISKKAG